MSDEFKTDITRDLADIEKMSYNDTNQSSRIGAEECQSGPRMAAINAVGFVSHKCDFYDRSFEHIFKLNAVLENAVQKHVRNPELGANELSHDAVKKLALEAFGKDFDIRAPIMAANIRETIGAVLGMSDGDIHEKVAKHLLVAEENLAAMEAIAAEAAREAKKKEAEWMMAREKLMSMQARVNPKKKAAAMAHEFKQSADELKDLETAIKRRRV